MRAPWEPINGGPFGCGIVYGPWAMLAQAIGQGVSNIMSGRMAQVAGQQENNAAQWDSEQLKQQAGQDQALGQRRAIEDRRQADLAVSRARAVAAAGGGGVSDPTVQNIIGDIRGRGEYGALFDLYTGDSQARALKTQADIRRFEGRQAEQAGNYAFGAAILNPLGNSAGSTVSNTVSSFQTAKADSSAQPTTILNSSSDGNSSMYAKYG